MTQRLFKPGDRVMTTSRDHEPYYGTVRHVAIVSHKRGDFLEGEVYVDWEPEAGSGGTYENPIHLTHAPKKPVRMRRVGWVCGLDFTRDPAEKAIWERYRGYLMTPVYARKGDK